MINVFEELNKLYEELEDGITIPDYAFVSTKKSLYGDNAEGFYLPFGELDDNGCGWQVFRTIKVNLLGKFVSISKDGETEGWEVSIYDNEKDWQLGDENKVAVDSSCHEEHFSIRSAVSMPKRKAGELFCCTDFNTAQDIFWICKSENIPLKVDSGDDMEDDSAARMLSGSY